MNKEIELLESEIIKDISDKITKQINDLIIEGLNLHGFEFENEKELCNFVKKYCELVNFSEINKSLYLIKGVPFLVFYKNDNFNFDLGDYAFLPKQKSS